MLDLSEESKEDNIKECEHYFARMAKMNRKSSLHCIKQL